MLRKSIKAKLYLLLGLACTLSAQTQAAELSLSTVPLFLANGVPPNIVLNLDDSTSMERGELFESNVDCEESDSCFASSDINKVYYNPKILYPPPVDENGVAYTDASFSNAWVDGYKHSCGRTNLNSRFELTHRLSGCSHDDRGGREQAYYNIYDPTKSGCPAGPITNFEPSNVDKCFTKVQVTSTSGTGPAGADERQNFANWYSYYRTRMLATKTASLKAFSTLGNNLRVGWIDYHSEDDITPGNKNYVRAFTGTHRKNFFDWMASHGNDSGTRTREAAHRVGQYMTTENIISPYADTPGVLDGGITTWLSCRQSYQVIFTDGEWFSGVGKTGNIDDSGATLPDNTVYNPNATYAEPYQDNNSDYLADNAFHYWKTDLQPNIANDVPDFFRVKTSSPPNNNDYWNPVNDPATWQHLVNFVITLGVNGDRTFPDDYNDLVSGVLNWGSDKIDDAWHAAINSRGEYFSASNTKELVDAFTTVLNRVATRTASGSGLAVNSTNLATLDRLYSASFSSDFWTGSLVAKQVTGGTPGATVYDAGCKLTGGSCSTDGNTYTAHSPNNRRIVTLDDSASPVVGIPFRQPDLNTAQLAAMNKDASGTVDNQSVNRVDFLRGDRSKESNQTGGIFRTRGGILGDIIHSTPRLVSQPIVTFPNTGAWNDLLHPAITIPENNAAAQSFASFTTTVSGRNGILYTGANDGMLHAFDAATGDEAFAYIPNALFSKLTNLSNPAYAHDYFVDGLPVSGEAFFNNAWKTVLMGNLRTGGQAVYALDITTEPNSGNTESDIATKAMWEFLHPDLGYGYGAPEIIRLHNGKWAAVFGNGYNNTTADGSASTTGNASLFIVDIETGNLIKQIDTGIGDTTTPNGIGNIVSLDADGDFIIDYVYGGDLLGNFWKFDLRSTATADWKVAYADLDTAPTELRPLAKAVESGGSAQQITGKPAIFVHPNGGHLLIFGTGKYLESADATLDTSKTNSIYGIWDQDVNPVGYTYDKYRVFTSLGRANTTQPLAPRTSQETTTSTGPVRTIEGGDIEWTGVNTRYGWYLDFPGGEMQFTPVSKFKSLAVLTNFKPSSSACDFGGDSWLYAFDSLQGRSEGITFDTNGDGDFNSNDNVTIAGNTLPIGSVKLGDAVVAGSVITDAGTYTHTDSNTNTDTEFSKAIVNTAGVGGGVTGTPIVAPPPGPSPNLNGRVNWRQIK